MKTYEENRATALTRLGNLTVSYPCLSPVIPRLRRLPAFESGVSGSRGADAATRQGLYPVAVSEASLWRVWQNPEDSVYDSL